MDARDAVLAVTVGLALQRGTRMLEPYELEAACGEHGVDHDGYVAALRSLKERGLVQLQVAEPSTVVLLAVTNAGLLRHLQASRSDLAAVEGRVWQAVAAALDRGAVSLAEEVGESPLLVECLLDAWVDERRLMYSKAPGRRFRVHRLLPGAGAASAEPTS